MSLEPTEISAEEAAEADKVRQAAELRRQRILEKANDRMGLVEGRVSAVATASSQETNNTNDGTTADADTNATTTATDASAAPADSEKPSGGSTTASRLAAMRKRRFKSGAATTTTAAASATATTTPEEAITASATTETTPTTTTTEDVVENETAAGTTGSAPAVDDSMGETKPAAETKDTQENEVVESSEAVTTTTSTTTSTSNTKYMGVAKMRRRMLQEKAAAAAASTDGNGNTQTSTTATTALKTAASAKKQQQQQPLLPIVMHVVTVLLLFLAGVDVGLQQGAVDYNYHQHEQPLRTSTNNKDANQAAFFLTVHSELAPRKMGGLQRTLSYILPSLSTNIDEAAHKPKIAQPEWQNELNLVDHNTDEFDIGSDTTTTTTTKSNSNIDPLFQVDLDTYTQGDGIYWSLARAAVRIHRLNLSLFYYGPRTLLQGLVDLLWSLLQSPPVLCVAAILLRQVVGKLVLGAQLPATKVGDEKEHKDVMTMIQNFVSTFVLQSFPTAVALYDVWTHLRADMYVVLGGFFVGLAWSHNAYAGSMYGSSNSFNGMDGMGDMESESQAFPVDEVPETVAEAISDTLADEL